MAKENIDKGAESAEMSEADAILEFLPDAAEALNSGKAESGKVKAEKPDPEADAESDEVTETEEADDDAGDDQADDDEADEEEEAEEKPAGSEKVQKRIDKLTARAKTAEEKATAVEAELEKVKAEAAELREAGGKAEVVAAPSADNPLSDVSSPAELTARVNNAVAVKRWCIENPDGGTVKNKDGEEVEIEPAQARKMLADAEEVITVHAPRRERFLQESEGHTKAARDAYPEMFKKGTEMEKAFQSLVRAWPEVTRFPDSLLVLGDYITGFKARTAMKPDAGKPAVEKKKPAIAPPVPKVSAAKTTSATKGPKLEHVLAAGATEDALTNYFAG